MPETTISSRFVTSLKWRLKPRHPQHCLVKAWQSDEILLFVLFYEKLKYKLRQFNYGKSHNHGGWGTVLGLDQGAIFVKPVSGSYWFLPTCLRCGKSAGTDGGQEGTEWQRAHVAQRPAQQSQRREKKQSRQQIVAHCWKWAEWKTVGSAETGSHTQLIILQFLTTKTWVL